MSQYLVDRITAAANIEVRLRTEISSVHGDGHLQSVELTDRNSGAVETVDTSWLFVFIGAAPRTDWLGESVLRDDRGFVVTGHDLVVGAEGRPPWQQQRAPLPLETTVPGVFAAGDVRLDSMKRVASAVGEGAMAVANIHQYLAMA
jgi:thioredoxin reductase (NADPH)